MRVAVVIPAKNEAASLPPLFEKLRQHGYDLRIVVVSDSTDDTDHVARSLGADVVRGFGEGLGAAMFQGLQHAARQGADIIASIDADGQFDPAELPKVVEPVLRGEVDLALGSRFLEPGLVTYPMTFSHRFGNRLLTWVVRRMTKLPITDAQTGFRAMRREVAERLELIGTHTYVQETIIDAVRKNFRVVEVPVHFHLRKHGESRVVASIRKYALWTLPVLVLRAGVHMSLFTILGLILAILGFGLGVYLLLWSLPNFPEALFPRLPALLLVVVLLLTGLQLFFFGFVVNHLILIKNRLERLR